MRGLATVRWMLVAVCSIVPVAPSALPIRADLDELMQRVLTRRDENWKKLQQYVLDERETIELRGPTGLLWGERRDYSWFMRDGYFVRSPIAVNGAAVADAERRKYETEFLRRSQRRDRRAGERSPRDPMSDQQAVDSSVDVGTLLQQTREPQFISSAYFLRFRFEEGRYAFVGREQLEGREVLRVEYYPSTLFPQGRRGPGRLGSNPVDAETRRLLNKVALVTLWIDDADAQVVKYTFDNVDLDFLPARWLIRASSVQATMTMAQPFPGVWLPRDVEINIGLALASGEFIARYGLSYHDYRRAEASGTLHDRKNP